MEHGLGLSTKTGLLLVVSALTLGVQRGLASLVLGHLVLGVLAALLAGAEGLARLGDGHLQKTNSVLWFQMYFLHPGKQNGGARM